MARAITKGRYNLTKAGYALVRDILSHDLSLLHARFRPDQLSAILNKPVPGATYFGLRNGAVLEIEGNEPTKKKRRVGLAKELERYQFTSEFQRFVLTDSGKEYFGIETKNRKNNHRQPPEQ